MSVDHQKSLKMCFCYNNTKQDRSWFMMCVFLTVGFSQQHLKAMMACLGIRSLSCGMSSACLPSPGHLPSLVLTTLPDGPHSDSWQLKAGSAWSPSAIEHCRHDCLITPRHVRGKEHGKPSHYFAVFFGKYMILMRIMKTKMLGNQKEVCLKFCPTTLDHHQR